MPICVSAQKSNKDTSHFPITDRRGDPFTYQSVNPFDIRDTTLILKNIEYDPASKQYYIVETIGNQLYRTPTSLTYDELLQIKSRMEERQYFQDRSKALDLLNTKQSRPKLRIYDDFFNRTFGVLPSDADEASKSYAGIKDQVKKAKDSAKNIKKGVKLVDIRPQGNFDLKLGYQGQVINNPTLSERARKTGGFDLDMNFNVNIMAKIGSKLTLPISYNTQSTFDFENQLKLQYQGTQDEILKNFEAGNLSFQSKGTLIPSMQNLFGVKARLQFGKLFVTTAIATDRSQKQSQTFQSGGASQTINKHLDDYDENRNFLLAQYFRNNFNKVMGALPSTVSQVQIQRMEVWVTNRTGTTTNARNIVGLADLGESAPNNANVHATSIMNSLPSNSANDLYENLSNNSTARNPSVISTLLQSDGLSPVNDFEKVYARKLDASEYTFNAQVGFLSLNQQLQPDDVLAVAYQYTYNGKVYQVGEFSQDVALDSTQGIQKILFLKLLKATSQRVQLPIWHLMMKNVYTLDNVTDIDSSSFKMNVYYQEPSGGTKRYMPEASTAAQGKSLLTLLNADRLNNRSDPTPDGQFDFISGYTVLVQQGKLIFPLLEPFGHDLDSLAYQGISSDIKQKYIYYALYDSIKATAQTYANLNRFVLKGTVKGVNNSQITLNAANLTQGSVTVTAGGQLLTENVDYTINYSMATLTITNQAILNSGVAVNVQYENNTGLSSQQRSFFGLRMDYQANEKLALGATMTRLTERPYFTKMSYGDDPINNTMYGVDFNYHSEWPGMTRFLDRLPFYTTTAQSAITAYGEAAYLKPGHPSQIGSGTTGSVYIDDFEGSNSILDLRTPFTAWALASTPGGKSEFPEASLKDSLDYGKNRAKIAWYNIEPTLQEKNNANNPLRGKLDLLSDPRTRAVYNNELFPQQSTSVSNQVTTTFDIAYYPTERGPYNFTTSASDLNAAGKLSNPKSRWGGLMRALSQTDFETNNYEYIEFWVQDPFIKAPTSTGGKLVFNLGNVSEDILKDGKRFYENGMNAPGQSSVVDSSSVWGKTPLNPIQLTNAFSTTATDRPYQDVGFDGLNDAEERSKRAAYLQSLASTYGTSSEIYQNALNDPSNDNYVWYRNDKFTAEDGILTRYKNYNNTQGNSPVADANSTFAPAATMYPDNEDLNGDNTVNETEEYFEYSIDLKPNMQIGDPYISDIRTITPSLANGTSTTEKWYLFRIPIKEYTSKIGNISDFKSIRFLRMYLTDFEDSTVLRFARLGLMRNQWRSFTYQLDTTGAYNTLPTNSNTTFDVLAVNIEDNSGRLPIPYKIPPGVERIQSVANNGVNVLQNEQAMSLRVNNLEQNDARAVFSSRNLDLRQYGTMSMFIHAESITGKTTVQNGQAMAVIRLGQDYLNNFYEIKIPLNITAPSAAASASEIWPTENELNLQLQELVQLKLRRNSSGHSISSIYRETDDSGRIVSVMGNPNLAEVQGFLLGIENAGSTQPLSAEVWFNELRLSKMDEKGAWAAMGRVDMQLADLGTMSISGNAYSKGWGSIDQSVNERSRNSLKQIDASVNIDAGKLLPRSIGATIPLYASINKTILTPEYDPYDQDVTLKYKLQNAKTKAERDSIKRVALDQSTTTTFNLTNVRFGQRAGRPKIWSLSNFDFSYSYLKIAQSSPLIEQNDVIRHRGGFGYTFNGQNRFITPFRKLIKSKSPWLAFLKDFNFNYTPSLLSFRADIDRQMGIYTPRVVNTSGVTDSVETVDTTYDKYFKFDRYYNLRWQLTKSINLDFSATNYARIDEPEGLINTKAKKDSVWNNFKKLGRTTNYVQRATASYKLPFDKLPMTDWIDANYSYTANYNWIGASLLTTSLGNVIENGQQNALNMEFNFPKLYDKFRWLRKANKESAADENVNKGLFDNNANSPGKTQKTSLNLPKSTIDTANMTLPLRDSVVNGLKGAERRLALRKWRALKRAIRRAKRAVAAAEKEQKEIGTFAKVTGQTISMVKRLTVNYGTTSNTRIPGFMNDPKYMGNNWKTMQPGLGFVFGQQPDRNWMDRMAAKGYLTKDSLFNDLFRQTYTQTLSLTAQVEPIKDFVIDISLQKSFSKDYTELFKDTLGRGEYLHLSPYASGGFSISYFSLKTAFNNKMDGDHSELFTKFSNYRTILSQRLGTSNRYSSGTVTNGYAEGYGQYSQDVLIPAFIAAYAGKDPNTVSLIDQRNPNTSFNPFHGYLPFPNWNITYTGLSRIPAVSTVFTGINLSHSYKSTLSMNSFTSALNYSDPNNWGSPGFIDETSGNYVPFYLVPNVTISESFEPLIGIDVTTKSQSNFRFSYLKSRTISLSLSDYQVTEMHTSGISLGGSFRKRGIYLPLPGAKRLESGNDLNLNLSLSIMDNHQINNVLDQSSQYSAGGQKVISISPSIDYILNQRINLKFYFDQQRVRPYISTSYPITTTSAGIQFRVSLAP